MTIKSYLEDYENFIDLVNTLAIMFERFERYFRKYNAIFDEFVRCPELVDIIDEKRN